METFMKPKEIAVMMRVSNMTVYRLIHSGDLPSIKIGRSLRVRESDVRGYLARQGR